MKSTNVLPAGKKGALILVMLELALLGLVGAGVKWQFAGMNRAVNELSDLKDPSPFRAALIGNLGRIHLAVQGFLRTADAAMQDQIANGLQEFEASIPEFQKQNAKLFPKDAVDDISMTFTGYKKSVEHVLEANTKRQAARQRLEQSFLNIITRITVDIKPLIRDHQPDAKERREAAVNVENQARAWEQLLTRSWAASTSVDISLVHDHESRGSTYLEQYTRMSLLARERKVLKEVVKSWEECGDLMPTTVALEKVVQESESFMNAQRELVVLIVNKFLPALSPVEMEARKSGFIWSMRLHGLVAVLLTLMALVSVYFAVKFAGITYRRGVPLQHITPTKEGPMIKMSLKGVLTGWSAAAEKLYGYSADEVLGETIDLLFESTEDVQRLYSQLTQTHRTAFQSMHKAKDGRLLKVNVEFQPVTDAKGIVSAIGMACKPI